MNGRELAVLFINLRSAGYRAYLVGGCVRDLLLGKTPEDYDIATTPFLPRFLHVIQRLNRWVRTLAW